MSRLQLRSDAPVRASTPPAFPVGPENWKLEPELDQTLPRRFSADLNPIRGDTRYLHYAYSAMVGFGVSFYLLLRGDAGMSRESLLQSQVFAWIMLSGFLGWNLYKYLKVGKTRKLLFEEGLPFPGRVVMTELLPVTFLHGQATEFVCSVDVTGLHPATGQEQTWTFSSRKFSHLQSKSLTISCRKGDGVTLLHHPGRPELGIEMYAMMGLRSDLGLIKKPAAPGETDWWQAIPGPLFYLLILFGPALFVFQYGDGYMPLRVFTPPVVPWMAAGAIAGWLLSRRLRADIRREKAREERALQEAIARGEPVLIDPAATEKPWMRRLRTSLRPLFGFGLPLFGAGVLLLICIYLNGRLDQRAATEVPVEIEEIWNGGNYQFVRYHWVAEDAESNRLQRPIGDPLDLRPGRAVADVRPGRFGIPWVQTLRQDPLPGNVQ